MELDKETKKGIDTKVQELQKTLPEGLGEREISWAQSGLYYGYPCCCIHEFCTDVFGNREVRSKAGQLNGKSTGFIPCTKHSEQINAGEITLESLIEHRMCKSVFPDPGDE